MQFAPEVRLKLQKRSGTPKVAAKWQRERFYKSETTQTNAQNSTVNIVQN